MDGRIMRRGIISSCQSPATSEIVKRCCSSLCKQRYSKYSDLYIFTCVRNYTVNDNDSEGAFSVQERSRLSARFKFPATTHGTPVTWRFSVVSFFQRFLHLRPPMHDKYRPAHNLMTSSLSGAVVFPVIPNAAGGRGWWGLSCTHARSISLARLSLPGAKMARGHAGVIR